MVRTRRDGGCAHHRTRNSELGVRDSEFLSVVRSTADGLRETCGALWMLIPTQTGLSRYTAPAQTLECTQSNCPAKRNYALAPATAAPMHETSAQMQGPSMAPANIPARIWVENMDVDNEPSSEDWNPGESSKRGMKGKGKQRQLETDHEMGGTTDAGVVRRPYRRLAKGTSTYHKPRCSECEKKNYVCEIESAGGACVRCYTQKAKCDKSWHRAKGGQRVRHAAPKKRYRPDQTKQLGVHTDGSASNLQRAGPSRQK